MLLIKTDDDPMVAGSPSRRYLRSLEERGVADGRAGLPPASEHPLYTTPYQCAMRIRRVEHGILAFTLGDAVLCTGCGELGAGKILLGCACEVRDFSRDQHGAFLMYGEGSTEQQAVFTPKDKLIELAETGVHIETLSGEDVTAALQLH